MRMSLSSLNPPNTACSGRSACDSAPLTHPLGRSFCHLFAKTKRCSKVLMRETMQSLRLTEITCSDLADKDQRDKMVTLVERMLELHRQKQAATSEASRARTEREINVTDEQIDALVYELYGLTEEEIEVVEGGSGSG